jgi:hypothetical protein
MRSPRLARLADRSPDLEVAEGAALDDRRPEIDRLVDLRGASPGDQLVQPALELVDCHEGRR